MFTYIRNRRQVLKLSAVRLCTALCVSESGYYKWKRNRHTVKRWQLVLTEMHTILKEHEDNDNYGVTRMKIALEQRGIKCFQSNIHHFSYTNKRIKALKNIRPCTFLSVEFV